jgi:hypothetical protein
VVTTNHAEVEGSCKPDYDQIAIQNVTPPDRIEPWGEFMFDDLPVAVGEPIPWGFRQGQTERPHNNAETI